MLGGYDRLAAHYQNTGCIISVSMTRAWHHHRSEHGFTIVELLVGAVIFPVIVIGLISVLTSVRQEYGLARQYDEIYSVLSACPEIDRALDYNSLSTNTNCYPNNSFPAEDGTSGTVTYTPSLTVTPTTSLSSGDPLYNIPNAKVLDISVGFQKPYDNFPALELRMLIARNGIGQS